jgi:putative effector of murein hydrolase LrgA (UPF0299 family)
MRGLRVTHAFALAVAANIIGGLLVFVLLRYIRREPQPVSYGSGDGG